MATAYSRFVEPVGSSQVSDRPTPVGASPRGGPLAAPSCPACATPPPRTSWSGAYHDLAADAFVGAELLFEAADGNYPHVELYRCRGCGQAWQLEHSYPGRPPYMAGLTRVEEVDVADALDGSPDAFVRLAVRHGKWGSLGWLPLGVALAATPAQRRAMRAHPELPEKLADYWDLLASRGSAL